MGGKRKLTFNEVKYFIESFEGYKLLSEEYIDSHTKLNIECPLGHIYPVTFNNFKAGHRCNKCMQLIVNNKMKVDFEKLILFFKELDLSPMFIKEDYKNQNSKLDYICNKHESYGIQTTSYNSVYRGKYICNYCNIESKIGENGSNWKGGITTLNKYMREILYDWKKNILQKYNYTCTVTGQSKHYMEIHHLYNFSTILNKTTKELNIKIKRNIGDYAVEDLSLIKEKLIEKHTLNIGILICKDIHKLFHNVYGNKNNTPEQFEEFKTRLKSGEFNLFLQEHNLKLTI